MPSETERQKRFYTRAFAGLVVLTTGLIVLGALVRAHDAGLACPDWPRCFGTWLPEIDLKVAFEVGHRYYAGAVAILFALLAIGCARSAALWRRARVPLGIGAALLATQIVLGGLTVLLRLAPWTVTAHLLCGNAFNASLLWTALRLGSSGPPAAPPRILKQGVVLFAGLLVLQIALGGVVSSNYAGLSCPEWPACNGGTWFPSLRGPVGLHLAHRSTGYAVFAAALGLAWLGRSQREFRGGLLLIAMLVLLQIALGIANVLSGLAVEITGSHSALAALLVLTTTWNAVRLLRRPTAAIC